MHFNNQVKAFESINKLFNLVLLYYKSGNKIKMRKARIIISEIILLAIVIWSLIALLAGVLITIIESEFYTWLNQV